jgi:hypothetical protein
VFSSVRIFPSRCLALFEILVPMDVFITTAGSVQLRHPLSHVLNDARGALRSLHIALLSSGAASRIFQSVDAVMDECTLFNDAFHLHVFYIME